MRPTVAFTVMFAAAISLAARAPVAKEADWVHARVVAWQPTPRELRWEQIGWAPNIRAAERLAREHDRPVFLFTHDGRLNVGRC